MLSKDVEKIYVIDTSVLLHNPHCLERFSSDGNLVVIPQCVIQEVDKAKKGLDEKSANSRTISRILDGYRKKGSLKEGVKTAAGGFIQVLNNTGKEFEKFLKKADLEKTNDNRIIFIGLRLKQEYLDKKVAVVSKDINCRIMADVNGVAAQDYEGDKASLSAEDLYGITFNETVEVDASDLTDLYRHGFLEWTDLSKSFVANQCFEFAINEKKALAIYKKSAGKFFLVEKETDFKKKALQNKSLKIIPKNDEQCFAYKLLIDNNIPLVALIGKAGTGKTLISLAVGYETLRKEYDQILVYRPNIPLGPDIGYLPGEISEKFAPWAEPIFDNLALIIGNENIVKKKRVKEDDNDFITDREKIRNMIEEGLVSIQPIIFVRGRTWNKKFVIIDECQNLTPHQVKTIITRAGEGTKVVLTGDPSQIDNPYLDSISNGLSYVVDKMRGQEEFGYVVLKKGERSKLSEIASRLL